MVSLGKAKRTMKLPTGSLQFRTLYVVGWPKGEEKTVIAVDKGF